MDAVIIGGGVVGLAILHEFAAAGREAVLLERHDDFGRETSSRNSEVVHGGMYYAPGSLKAALSTAGRRLLYEFASRTDVRHNRCGKIIVASTPEEEEALDRILATGTANGVEGLRFLSSEEIARREPNILARTALFSPETGIIDAHGLMNALHREAEALGGAAVPGAEATALERVGDEWEVAFRDTDGDDTVTARVVVNAAGLSAQAVMRMAGLRPEEMDLTLYPCKGCYFSLSGSAGKRINALVYPAPEANLAGLGVHTVVDLGGRVRLGPDTEYIEPAGEYDYAVAPERREAFFASARRYLPFLEQDDLAPDFSGVRPKLSGPGQAARDFYLTEESAHGAPGFVNLVGIESPGLTACLAIAKKTVALTKDFLNY